MCMIAYANYCITVRHKSLEGWSVISNHAKKIIKIIYFLYGEALKPSLNKTFAYLALLKLLKLLWIFNKTNDFILYF